jgi:cob(I)alamin adenosyltransferase
MKIYTRTGDEGETGLFGGGRVRKDHARVEAYGAIDELNSFLGFAIGELQREACGDLAGHLRILQSDLFSIGGSLAAPVPEEGGRATSHLPALPTERTRQMERWIDLAEEELEPLGEFILPGGTEAAARLHLARTVCRRAERRVISLSALARVESSVVPYLNRLSDLLFTLARVANRRASIADIKWRGEREADRG